jgi:hypothetical protein
MHIKVNYNRLRKSRIKNNTYFIINHEKLINGWVHSLYSLVWFSNHIVLIKVLPSNGTKVQWLDLCVMLGQMVMIICIH